MCVGDGVCVLVCVGVRLSAKLRGLGFPNRIVDNSDSKPSEFERQLPYKSNSKTTIKSTIAISM